MVEGKNNLIYLFKNIQQGLVRGEIGKFPSNFCTIVDSDIVSRNSLKFLTYIIIDTKH